MQVLENHPDTCLTNSGASVAIEFANHAELEGPQPKLLAIQTAGKLGLANAGISGAPDVYPVDEEGNEIKDGSRPFDHLIGIFRLARL